jgi:hypothetical protein
MPKKSRHSGKVRQFINSIAWFRSCALICLAAALNSCVAKTTSEVQRVAVQPSAQADSPSPTDVATSVPAATPEPPDERKADPWHYRRNLLYVNDIGYRKLGQLSPINVVGADRQRVCPDGKFLEVDMFISNPASHPVDIDLASLSVTDAEGNVSPLSARATEAFASTRPNLRGVDEPVPPYPRANYAMLFFDVQPEARNFTLRIPSSDSDSPHDGHIKIALRGNQRMWPCP